MPSEDAMTKAWPSDFRLKDALEEYHKDHPDSISKLYPNHRRQRRLSYSAAYLLEAILPIGDGSAESDNFRGSRSAPVFSSSESDNTGTFETDESQELRARLLAVPSTKQRLKLV